jgi:hypothetical protein
MSIKKELLEQKKLILNGGKVDVALFKVRSIFKRYFLNEEDSENNYRILVESWKDNKGNYGANDTLYKRERIAGLLDVMIEEIRDEVDHSILEKKSKTQMKIFISHASANKAYGDALLELLLGLNVPHEQIIYTSNAAYGIPNNFNIFEWLKKAISEKPFVIYLLSKQYYESVACLNEMGAAWVVGNQYAVIFTPDFNLASPEFQNGALDPRKIGVRIDNEDRLLLFIEQLKESFAITHNPIITNQKVKAFLQTLSKIESDQKNASIKTETAKKKENTKPDIKKDEDAESVVIPVVEKDSSNQKKTTLSTPLKNVYDKLLSEIRGAKLRDEELILLHYVIESSRVKLGIGWQEADEIERIREWQDITELSSLLSNHYGSVMRRFELRKYTDVSQYTGSGNPKEVRIKPEIEENILELPDDIIERINSAVKRNHEDPLPF